MEDNLNFPLPNKKRKFMDNKVGKEKLEDEEITIISQPSSFGFNLGINLAISCGSHTNKELSLLLKFPKI
jgi:hypothetical protein